MNPTGTRLAQAQVKGHLRIDDVYDRLADAVEAEVLRWASPDSDGKQQLTPTGSSLAVLGIGSLIDAAGPEIIAAVLAARQDAIDAAQVGHDPLTTDTLTDQLAMLQARADIARGLQNARPGVLAQTTQLLVRGVGVALDAREIARRVGQYFNPWFAPRRNVTGQRTRESRQGAVASWPGQAGMASQHVRLVMLYETTWAHGRVISRIAERDKLDVQWNLSYQHREIDGCDQRHRHDVGLGPGIYPFDEAPPVPSHYGCRCYYSTSQREAGVQVQAA